LVEEDCVSLEVPAQVHYTFDSNAPGTRVVIPRRRIWFLFLFLTFWLGGWVIGEVSAAKELLANNKPSGGSVFLIFWLCAWTVGGAFALWTWIQMLTGQQVVDIESGILTLSGLSNPLKRSKQFDLGQVKNLRVAQQPSYPLGGFGNNGRGFWTGGPEALKFDYGADTLGFGQGLSEAEASGLVEELKRRHPTLGK
jgi:hypothetical protein